MKWITVSGILSFVAIGACAADGASPPGPALSIKTAPLSLPGITNACYTITVRHTADIDGVGADDGYSDTATVWTESDICAQSIAGGPAYGIADGSLTYVGPCDADNGDGDGPAHAYNQVQLVLTSVWAGGANIIADVQNPCTDGVGGKPTCQQTILCSENADAAVEFNITLMRSAEQGFFDVAVNFEDLFCSAKFDCEYANGDAIKLLFNNGKRDNTAVLAFACTSGADTPTTLYLDDLTIACGGDAAIALETAPADLGNHAAPAPLFGYAVYAGEERLAPYTKGYWNVALGFDATKLGSGKCRVRARATASEGDLASHNAPNKGWNTPANTAYPVIDFDVTLGLTGTSPNQKLDCGSLPLNTTRGDSSVTTEYSDVTATGECFDNQAVVSTTSITLTDEACAPPVVAPPALYFFSDGTDTGFWTVANWWLDAAHTQPAGRTPIDGDALYLTGTHAWTDASIFWPKLSVARFDSSMFLNSFGQNDSAVTSGLSIASGGVLVVGVAGDVDSYQHGWRGTTADSGITATFQGRGRNLGFIGGGTVTFNGHSTNESELGKVADPQIGLRDVPDVCTAIFNDASADLYPNADVRICNTTGLCSPKP